MAHTYLSVRELTAGESSVWDELVLSSRQGAVYLLHDFLKMWAETEPGLHLTRIGCYDEQGRLVGGQAIFHRKVLGVRVQNNLSIAHTSTPILPQTVQDQGRKRYQILEMLARESSRLFPYLRAEFHPSLIDARPFLEQGWRVVPKYTHLWDISDPEALLSNMQRKRRYYVRNAQKNLTFGGETGDSALREFVHLYRADMKKFNWRPERSWDETFTERVLWMEGRGCFRLYSCRTKEGRLLGMVTVILSRMNQTAYGWLMAYDHSGGNQEFTPAINWFVAQELSSEFRSYDIGESYRPSLYTAKDSLGNSSVPYWVVATPSTKGWTRVYNQFRDLKQTLSGILQ